MSKKKALVAIVGRPNVGKSALFNRLIGRRQAILAEEAGTTRDRIYADCEWGGQVFTLIDTGGLDLGTRGELQKAVHQQAKVAIDQADLILLVVDVTEGLHFLDQEVAQVLRESRKPVILVANKVDNQKRDIMMAEFYRLGVGEPRGVSALHGTGTGDLLDEILEHLPECPEEVGAEVVRVAIVGRPNVGKSSLLNALLGEERVVVHPEPGTTRDTTDTFLEFKSVNFILVDTAGIRRRGKIAGGIERYSVLRTIQAINRADIALLVIDASEGLTLQDAHIAGYVQQATVGLVLVVNKWDLMKGEDKAEFTREIRGRLSFIPFVPILYTSALSGYGVGKVLDEVLKVAAERAKRVPTAKLNELVAEAVARHALPAEKGRTVRVMYVTQTAVNPPTFVFFVNEPKAVHFSYRRYLENQIRERFGFEGTPLKFVFRRQK